MQQRQAPGDHRSPVVPDDGGAFGTEGIKQADQIPGQRRDVVSLDRVRPG
jgi:hypothetical protein